MRGHKAKMREIRKSNPKDHEDTQPGAEKQKQTHPKDEREKRNLKLVMRRMAAR